MRLTTTGRGAGDAVAQMWAIVAATPVGVTPVTAPSPGWKVSRPVPVAGSLFWETLLGRAHGDNDRGEFSTVTVTGAEIARCHSRLSTVRAVG